jgi:MFS family permease
VGLIADGGSHTRALDGGSNLLFVTLISIVSAMGGFLFGYETVVIAGTISMVKEQFQFSAFMEGWFVSSGLVGCVVGVVVAGALCDRIGRKRVMMLSGALLAAAALGCAFAPSASWLIVARVTGGVGVGLASIVSPLYISEVAPPEFRGRLVSLFQLTITVGIVAAMLINAELLRRALTGPEASVGLAAGRSSVAWNVSRTGCARSAVLCFRDHGAREPAVASLAWPA